MSDLTQAGLTTSREPDVEPHSVPMRKLLQLYLSVPILFAVVAVDWVLLDSQLRSTLRTFPESYLLLALVFGTPHIVASNMSLFSNPDYVHHYRQRILGIAVGILVSLAVLGYLFPRWVLVVLIVGWTVHHVLKQQLGIGNIAARLSGPIFVAWSWVGVACGTLYYSAVLLNPSVSELYLIRQIVFGGAVIVAALTILLWFQAPESGRIWLVANSAMMIGSSVMFVSGYTLFAVLIPRLAHDVTAYVFYINHETNRLRHGRRSLLHRPLSRWLHKQPAAFAIPVASLLAAAFLERVADGWLNAVLDSVAGVTLVQPISFGFVGFLGLMHYSFESFTWKGASPYREYVAISVGK